MYSSICNAIRLLSVVLFPVLAVAAGEVYAYDGAALLKDCTAAIRLDDDSPKKPESPEESLAATRCVSFSKGAFAVLRSLQISKNAGRLVCAPAGAKQEQVTRIVAKWLKDNPSKLHLPAEYAVIVSLREAFPCPKKTRTPGSSTVF